MSQTGFDLLSPNILLFVDFHSLVKLKQLCKFYQKSVDDESKALGYWPAVCNSFCYYGGIFSPVIFNPEFIYPINYRKHFFEDLWPQRSKWATLSEDGNHIIPSTQAYKVRVACRFRPGETQEGRVCLPLHQFLKLKRQQKLKQQQEVTEILVGEKDPEEFLDPFLGSLMKDPVRLKTSNRVCDRSVALQCILRGGRDPFNNRKLSQAMLEPLPELANRIREWKAKADERKDVSVDINETKSLVDASGFNNDLLEALLEIESIHRTMKKIKEQESNGLGFSNYENFEAPLDGVNEPLEPQNEMPAPNEIVGVGLDVGDEFIAEVENTEPNFFGLNGNAHIAPISNQEDQLPGKKAEHARVTDVNHQRGFVSMHIPGAGIRPFHYSQVYPTTTKQLEIYEASVKESVHSVLNGCNSCIMCYGQTGSGKTFTFLGPEGCLENLQGEDRDLANIFTQYPTLGLVLRTTDDLFLAKDHFEKYQITMNIGIQMIEVYDEKTTDLLTGRPVTVRRDTGNINGPIVFVQNQSEFLQYLKTAHANQRYAETAMNQRSSRAHTVFLFHITQQFTPHSSSSSKHGKPLLLQSQLHLVDLAGSERVKRSRVTGIHLREAVGINSSLLVLGKVISSLVKGRSHVPYLESKLTTILKSAFGGNARTTVIINTRIEGEHGDETLQTLRFGERCAMISNTLKQLASSYEDTLSILDQSLEALNKQIISFQSKEKTQLSAYRTLLESFSNLTRKREELLLLKKEQDPGVSMENLKDSMI